MPTQAEREFHREMVEGSNRLTREIGYKATRFNQIVAEHGGPAAARQLLTGRDASDGLTTPWEAGRLDMSVEAAALLPWYEASHRRAARRCMPGTSWRAIIVGVGGSPSVRVRPWMGQQGT